MVNPAIPAAFRTLSARLGSDPLQIQGPGGNTSFKRDGTMWIKASGTELADAETKDIFVAVDLSAARAVIDGAGDGTCRAAMLDRGSPIRPSIETTFHALFDRAVVAHTHSVAALAHVASDEGTAEALRLLTDLDVVEVPYRKPGLPLTLAIREAIGPSTRTVLLRNHGLIAVGDDADEVDSLIREVEARLVRDPGTGDDAGTTPPEGWVAVEGATGVSHGAATAGSYWPDHVVFLGPAVAASLETALPEQKAALSGGSLLVRAEAQPIAHEMARCLAGVLARVPGEWRLRPIGEAAEAELMNWDAETYRQKLAGRT